MKGKMEKVTDRMLEHICDEICKKPCDDNLTEEGLAYICENCKVEQYARKICAMYKEVADKLVEAELELEMLRGNE